MKADRGAPYRGRQPSRRGAPVVCLRPSDGADPEAVLEAVICRVGAGSVMATYADGLTIEVLGLRGEQVPGLLEAALAIDPLIHASTGTAE